jgi:hypothetical protein
MPERQHSQSLYAELKLLQEEIHQDLLRLEAARRRRDAAAAAARALEQRTSLRSRRLVVAEDKLADRGWWPSRWLYLVPLLLGLLAAAVDESTYNKPYAWIAIGSAASLLAYFALRLSKPLLYRGVEVRFKTQQKQDSLSSARLTGSQLLALREMAIKAQLSGDEVLFLRRAAERELTRARASQRMPLNTVEDWLRFRSTLGLGARTAEGRRGAW